MRKVAIFLAFVTSAMALILVTVGKVGVDIAAEPSAPQRPLGVAGSFVITFVALFVLTYGVSILGWWSYLLVRRFAGPGRRR